MQQDHRESNKAHLGGCGRERERTHFDACRHRANTPGAVPIVLGDPVVCYVNTAKFRHRAGSDFMSNVRLSLPLRWSALPAANLSDRVLGIMRSLVLGGVGSGAVGAKTVRSLYCYYSYFLPYAEKTVQCYKAAKEGKTLYYWCDIVQSRHLTQHRNFPRQTDRDWET